MFAQEDIGAKELQMPEQVRQGCFLGIEWLKREGLDGLGSLGSLGSVVV